MSFEDQLQRQFDNMSLQPIKMTTNLVHLYADFAELLALFSNDAYFTAADLIERFKAYGVSLSQKQDDLSDRIDPPTAEVLDREEASAVSVFSFLKSRAQIYGDDYAFTVDETKLRLKTTLTTRQKMYLMLLAAANLNYFSKMETTLTTEFEQVSFEALKCLLPSKAVVKQFGKNSDYSGTAREKIRALAKDMNVEVNEREVETIQGTQERGLDVVGWLPFNDRIPNMVSVFGQCTCEKKWFKKQHETRRFDSSYFRFCKRGPIHAMFVPYSLNRFDGMFYQSDEIFGDTLLVERKRILDLIHDAAFFDALDSSSFVEKCVDFMEDIV